MDGFVHCHCYGYWQRSTSGFWAALYGADMAIVRGFSIFFLFSSMEFIFVLLLFLPSTMPLDQPDFW